MDSRIIFQLEGCPVSVMIPMDCGLTIEQIGEKDIPQGVPFWVVEASAIPVDRSLRAAWEIDESRLGKPSGYGTREAP